jgi:hypothetical protein
MSEKSALGQARNFLAREGKEERHASTGQRSLATLHRDGPTPLGWS